MKKIFLITMIHFDNLEKTQIRARDSQIIGFADTQREAMYHVAMYADPRPAVPRVGRQKVSNLRDHRGELHQG